VSPSWAKVCAALPASVEHNHRYYAVHRRLFVMKGNANTMQLLPCNINAVLGS
jgi:hypothetical protein